VARSDVHGWDAAYGRVMPRHLLTFALAAATAALLAACGSGGADKAGGSSAPVVLRLSTLASPRPLVEQPDYFAQQVAKLSHNAIRIDVVREPETDNTADADALVAQSVRAGRADLGWMAARAWDGLGVKSFQALQAPFLIEDEAVLHAVAESDIPARTLAGLRGTGFEGLALVPGRLRHFFGTREPLSSPRDFEGVRVRVLPSAVTDAVVEALGSRPIHTANREIGDAIPTLAAR
jgi:TRAP-type C4-dicarboxylate transport system substrate-binding protein